MTWGMRIAGAGMALLAISSAQAQTAGELLHACELFERGMHREGSTIFVPPGISPQLCWGFMTAVMQYATLADHDGKTLLGACPPPDTTTSQIVRVFVSYAQAHPQKLSLRAAAVAYNAMKEAFPCK